MNILLGILFFFLALIFIALIIVASFINRVKNFLGGNKQTQSTKSNTQRTRTTHYTTGETIIDERNSEQTHRKIFSKNEGEYIDYEEEN